MARSKLPEATVIQLVQCQRWGVCDAGTADMCAVAVPFTIQTRLTFDVVLPLWGHRGPRPTPSVHVHHGRLSARERQRS